MGKTGKKRSKVQMPAGIRNKMMAAVSMLMVSCIMLVSSTYAWFTLSTAPEITGITTNVGANGNLEMMLLNAESYASTADNLGVDSKVGDSSAKQAVTLANETWGNLVDLSADTYGLSSVMLMPSKLKLTDATSNVIAGTILNTPTYGKDGRVISVENSAMTGKYNSSWVYDATAVGVRALGTSSGTTLRLNEYTDALFYMGDLAGKAQTTARESLTQNAQPLANLIIDKALDATSFDKSYLDDIENIISGTSAANAHIESMIRYALLAWNLSDEATPKDDQGNKVDLSDEQVKSIKATIMADSFDVTNIPSNILVPNSVQGIVDVYKNTKSVLTDANNKLNTLKSSVETKETISWEEVSSVLSGLVDTNKVAVSSKNYTLQDYTSNKISKEDLINAIASDVMTDKIALPITMLPDSGVYYNIAKVCGAYIVNGKVNVTYGTIFNNFPVDFKMTQAVEGDVLVTAAITYIQTIGKAPEVDFEGGNSAIALSDTYGYMLDFGFRTNAAGSNLLLQTAEKQRVYSSGPDASTSTATQGGGSYMEFTSTNPQAFSVDEMRALMSAIRVAFVKPNISGTGTTYELLALGGLDITASDPDNNGLVTYTGGTANGNDTLKADLVLFNYSYDAQNETIRKGDKLVEGTTGTDGSASTTPVTTITRLDQNVAAKVSVIVYLDGTIVDNTMVANANTSMSGKLNLQFSSDATLVPMKNSGMKAGGLQAQDAPAPNYGEPISNLNKVVEFGEKSYSVAVADGYSVYRADNNNYYYKANNSEQYIQINIDDYTVLSKCPAFTVTEVTQ